LNCFTAWVLKPSKASLKKATSLPETFSPFFSAAERKGAPPGGRPGFPLQSFLSGMPGAFRSGKDFRFNPLRKKNPQGFAQTRAALFYVRKETLCLRQ
jgi:hypothetical protein